LHPFHQRVSPENWLKAVSIRARPDWNPTEPQMFTGRHLASGKPREQTASAKRGAPPLSLAQDEALA